MSKTRMSFALAAAFGALLLAPPRASALYMSLNTTGWTVIGYLSNVQNPGNWMATAPAGGGACQWLFIGNGPNHGLNSNTEVHAFPGNGGDIIQVLTGPNPPTNSICGYTAWTYPLLNGYYLDIYGEGGADVLLQGTDANSYAFGGSQQDWVYGNLTSAGAFGDSENDVVFGWDHGGDHLEGGDGTDVLCEHRTSNANFMDCGAGANDGTCGSADTRVNCETAVNAKCSSCGSGY